MARTSGPAYRRANAPVGQNAEVVSVELKNVREGLHVESADLTESHFYDVQLKGSRFENVSLQHASFRNVSLADATITDATLSGVCITNCNLEGMSIDGIRVSDLLQAYRRQLQGS